MFNKQEIKYIFYSGIFALVWFMFALPWIVKTFDGQSAYFQFFAFNLGLYCFFFLFLKSVTTSTSLNIKGSLGLLSLFLALDIWMPEYHVAISGELIKGGLLGVGASDYFFGLIGSNFGITGIMLYGFTYLVVPILLLFISSKLIPNFVRSI